jgi:abortive infection bacteriophage resistance protein
MVTVLVKHEWPAQSNEEVQKFFSQLTEATKLGKLPVGFNLTSAYIDKETRNAFCIWQVPSVEAFDKLAKQLASPTNAQTFTVERLA